MPIPFIIHAVYLKKKGGIAVGAGTGYINTYEINFN